MERLHPAADAEERVAAKRRGRDAWERWFQSKYGQPQAVVEEELIHKFMTNENLSPSQQTLTLATLAEMKGVEGLDGLLRIAADADGVDVAEFNLANNLFLAAYHKFHKPVIVLRPNWMTLVGTCHNRSN